MVRVTWIIVTNTHFNFNPISGEIQVNSVKVVKNFPVNVCQADLVWVGPRGFGDQEFWDRA